MSVSGSVSRWISAGQDGDTRAIEALWQRYYEPLVRRARHWIHNVSRIVDEEDLAASAFESFFRGLAAGRFSYVATRSDVWSILLRITERKAINQVRRETSLKRGGGRLRGDSALSPTDDDELQSPHAADVPSPDFTVALMDTFHQLLGSLDDDQRLIVLMRLHGRPLDEIATTIARSVATVERRLRLIQIQWERVLVNDTQ